MLIIMYKCLLLLLLNIYTRLSFTKACVIPSYIEIYASVPYTCTYVHIQMAPKWTATRSDIWPSNYNPAQIPFESIMLVRKRVTFNVLPTIYEL